MLGDATLGRIVLLVSAYAPAAVIVGLRALPAKVGAVFLVLGIIGLLLWALFLWWLPGAQNREVEIEHAEAVDPEVTGFIASYLLPVVAATTPSSADVVAYVFCALLILVVAFRADLGAVNPIVYLFGLRVIRARIASGDVVMLAHEVPLDGAVVSVTTRLSVVRLIEVVDDGRD